MTLEQLSQLYHLNREIELWEDEKEKIEAALNNMAAYTTTVTASRAEFPYTPYTVHIGGIPVRVKDTTAYIEKRKKLNELSELVERKKEECFIEYGRLLQYIDHIPDGLTRQIFMLRFVNGLPWSQVAYSIGGNNTAEGVRKTCYRYISAND